MLPLGVCVFAEPAPNRPRSVAYPNYVHEILAHAGVAYEKVASAELIGKLPGLKVLLTIGDAGLKDDAKAKIREWLNAGGQWVNVCGLCGLEDVLGVKSHNSFTGWGAGLRTLGEGYLAASKTPHPVTGGIEKPLHFFNGLGLTPTTATVIGTALDAHGREKNEPVLFEQKVGQGRTLTIGVDVTGTIVHVQQGRCVTRDGVPAPDGATPISDGVLKSGDGGVLDWIFDRDDAPGTGYQAFLRPVADLWREVLLRSILHCASEAKVGLPVLWYWPRNLPAVAHMSHDSDGNEPAKGWHLLELLQQAEIHTTWCIILPGYEKDLISAIHTAGHELATHFDSMTDGLDFTEAQFERQWRELVALFEGNGPWPATNKNHYLRWEGDMEFFDWCAKRGIQMDQSKGASKTGEAGYNFGSCHTYFPVRFNGEVVNVLELATPTQDLHVFAKEEMFDALLAVAQRHHGVVHLLYHPAHTTREDVGGSLVRVAKKAKAAGLEWWTGRQINDWERARRTVTWSDYSPGGSVKMSSTSPLPGATVLWLGGKGGEPVTRWGFEFSAKAVDLRDGQAVTF
jgi:hypothetical protein